MAIDRDPLHLHPTVREAVSRILAACAAQGLPFAVFEAYRSPERQAGLYAQGRTAPGAIVTHARPGESYHQYGLAVDIVGLVGGQWTWDRPDDEWKALHVLGRSHGMEPLNFETPHLQMIGLKIADLRAGRLPPGGDASWQAALDARAPLPNLAPVRVAAPLPPVAPKPEMTADELNARELARHDSEAPPTV